jgi:hypothetical protein
MFQFINFIIKSFKLFEIKYLTEIFLNKDI